MIVLAVLAVPAAAIAAGSSGKVYVTNCTKASYKPKRLDLACDGTNLLTDLKWTSWSSSRASGKGTDSLNTCTPDCANGKRHKLAATVTLSKPASCPGVKRKIFKHVVVEAKGKKKQTIKLACPSIGGGGIY